MTVADDMAIAAIGHAQAAAAQARARSAGGPVGASVFGGLTPRVRRIEWPRSRGIDGGADAVDSERHDDEYQRPKTAADFAHEWRQKRLTSNDGSTLADQKSALLERKAALLERRAAAAATGTPAMQ
jgi:hypothetical protein